jgi:hypothetical protein
LQDSNKDYENKEKNQETSQDSQLGSLSLSIDQDESIKIDIIRRDFKVNPSRLIKAEIDHSELNKHPNRIVFTTEDKQQVQVTTNTENYSPDKMYSVSPFNPEDVKIKQKEGVRKLEMTPSNYLPR